MRLELLGLTVMNHFEVFELPIRFGIDEAALQKRFYELSRENHPDRFAGQGPLALQASLEKMSRVNQAYTVLKDRRSRRAHVLGLVVSEPKQKAAIPLELAESWFELQDALLEGGMEAKIRLAAFRIQLETFRNDCESEAERLERAFDQGEAPAAVQLARLLREQTYLESLSRDLDSKMGTG